MEVENGPGPVIQLVPCLFCSSPITFGQQSSGKSNNNFESGSVMEHFCAALNLQFEMFHSGFESSPLCSECSDLIKSVSSLKKSIDGMMLKMKLHKQLIFSLLEQDYQFNGRDERRLFKSFSPSYFRERIRDELNITESAEANIGSKEQTATASTTTAAGPSQFSSTMTWNENSSAHSFSSVTCPSEDELMAGVGVKIEAQEPPVASGMDGIFDDPLGPEAGSSPGAITPHSDFEEESNSQNMGEGDFEYKGRFRKKRVTYEWELKQVFPTEELALAFLKERSWARLKSYDLKTGRSVSYYCAKHGKECKAQVKLVYPVESVEVEYYEAQMEHTDIPPRIQKMPQEVRDFIRQKLSESRLISTNRVLQALKLKGIPPPTKIQLQRYMSYEKMRLKKLDTAP